MNGNQRDRNPLLLLMVLTALSILLMITILALGMAFPFWVEFLSLVLLVDCCYLLSRTLNMMVSRLCHDCKMRGIICMM
jgi:hypothetical protein